MSQQTEAFIAKYKDAVIDASKGTGLFPSVTMAQMILESTWGRGITAVRANNFFGIKADPSWTGKKMLFNTPRDAKPTNFFRVYNTPEDSIKDHDHFLIQNTRYDTAGAFKATTPEAQAQALAAAGYAESKNYANTLISLINAYNLKELDKPQAPNLANIVGLIFIVGLAYVAIKRF